MTNQEIVRLAAKDAVVRTFQSHFLQWDLHTWNKMVQAYIDRICDLPKAEFFEIIDLYRS